MEDQPFTLVIAGDLEDHAVLDALFEGGCDDATFGMVEGIGYGDFFHQGPGFAEAVRSAITRIESVPGLRVLRVEPDDLVTMSEIADRLGRSREGVRLLISGARGAGGFPPPISHLRARSRLWRWSEVAAWADQNGLPSERRAALLVAAINAALALRESIAQLAPEEQRLVASLA